MLTLTWFVQVGCTTEEQVPPRQGVLGIAGGWSNDAARAAEYAKVAEDGFNVRRVWREGARQWTETLLDLDDPFFTHDARRTCGKRYVDEIGQPCNYKVELVLAPEAATRGRIVFVRSVPIGEDVEDACLAYADCTAQAWLEETIRIPPSSPEPLPIFVVMQGISIKTNPHLNDLDRLDRLITEVEGGLDALATSIQPDDYQARYRLQNGKKILSYIKLHRERLARGE